jgi:GMP synthase PP-ATPase subunit
MKPRLTPKNKKLIQAVNDLIHPLGCEVTGLGSNAIGVLGDARSVGVAIVIKCRPDVDVVETSTLIINKVRGITRVMMDIP